MTTHGFTGPGHCEDMPEFGTGLGGGKGIWPLGEGEGLLAAAALVCLARHLENLQETG